MVAIIRDHTHRFFKSICERIQTHSQYRKSISLAPLKKIIPLFYVTLGGALALNAHTSSQNAGVAAWIEENPPTLGMITGELAVKKFTPVIDEKKSRQLYRSFPFKNSKKGMLYLLASPRCLALTNEPEKEAIPHFYCQENPGKTIPKSDWKNLGFGWLGLQELQKLTPPPLKQISNPISYDSREIRY